MSRSSAKERGRVRTSGRFGNTLRTMENFGSWKHICYLPHDCPKIPSLNRRFIGGENRGRKLKLDTRLIELRKPTERMVTKFEENLWSGPEFRLVTIKKGSNYPNRTKLRRMAKDLATAEMSAYLEEQRERQQLEQQEAAEWPSSITEELEIYHAEQERAAELAELERRHFPAISSRQKEWGYHHYF